MIVKTLQPPYYAVIFTSVLKEDHVGYFEMAEKMEQLAKKQPGYLGFESARSGIGISISYWKELDNIKSWKMQTEHLLAQESGIKEWYKTYHIRVARVEREYGKE